MRARLLSIAAVSAGLSLACAAPAGAEVIVPPVVTPPAPAPATPAKKKQCKKKKKKK